MKLKYYKILLWFICGILVFICGIVMGSNRIAKTSNSEEIVRKENNAYSVTAKDGSWAVDAKFTSNAIFIVSTIPGVGSCSINAVNYNSSEKIISYIIVDDIRKKSITYDHDGVINDGISR